MTAALLPEIAVGRRAFPVTQELFFGAPSGVSQQLAVGWYDAALHSETGAFAVVPADDTQDDLIGEIVSVTFASRTVFAYVITAATLPAGMQFALARRAFAGMARLSLEAVLADVVPVAA